MRLLSSDQPLVTSYMRTGEESLECGYEYLMIACCGIFWGIWWFSCALRREPGSFYISTLPSSALTSAFSGPLMVARWLPETRVITCFLALIQLEETQTQDPTLPSDKITWLFYPNFVSYSINF